jgi:hypothetical protein
LDLNERKWREAGEGLIMGNFITCSLHQILMMGTRRLRGIEHVARMEGMRNAYKYFA